MNKNDTIKSYILSRINNHIYTEGQLIESEYALSETLDASRMTVRKAIQELVDEGILFKEKGRGTFVSIRPKYAEFHCGTAFSQEVRKLGMLPSTIDATLNRIPITPELAEIFQTTEDEDVWVVSRIRCADGNRVVFALEYFLYRQCPDLTIDIVNDSIFDFLEDKGIHFHHADQKLVAFKSDTIISKSLDIELGHPLIKMVLTSMTQNGIVFNYSTEYFNTDYFSLTQAVYHRK